MNTKQIECILDLRNTLNFNRTAENLYTSQSTVSYTIKSAEEEIGFQIFERIGKSVSITPAGEQFCITLKNLYTQYKEAVNQGQNFAKEYKEDITISIPFRSALYYLPDAIKQFNERYPDTSITVHFNLNNGLDRFLKDEEDILLIGNNSIQNISKMKVYSLFKSYFYLVSNHDDPLSKKELINASDLENRTLMVGGPSPRQLINIQQNIIQNYHVKYFNSISHDTTLTYIAANKGICISPGILNDFSNLFKWTKYDSDEYLEYVLCVHNHETNPKILSFIEILCQLYRNNTLPL